MSRRPSRPSFSFALPESVDDLSVLLATPVSKLEALAAQAGQMYRHVPKPKPDGTTRDTWDAFPPLKKVQEQIKNRILQRVSFPLYLQTGIRDKEFPRDYARNAAFHAGAYCVVTFDIKNYFPSITAVQVRAIWSDFFRLDVRVADILTALTTMDGFVPQGAKTSSYLANLAFWKDEHEMHAHLRTLGWEYSRLADDVTVSTKNRCKVAAVNAINRTVIGFIQRHGFHVKRSKHKIFWRNDRMLVNNLVTNIRSALPKEERRKIRAQVDRVKTAIAAGRIVSAKSRNSAIGKEAKLRRFHAATADKILGIVGRD